MHAVDSSVAVSFAFACPSKNATVNGALVADVGVVYVYTVSSAGDMALEATLTHSIGAATLDRLGNTPDGMSMSGNTLVVGMVNYETSCKPTA